ncbi:MAG: CocE/NonD family hydrolase, partial [Motilibacteraceae bacterium]
MSRLTGPGRAAWAARRLANAVRPRVEVTPAPPMQFEHDVPVQVRDGTTLRLNVYRPLGDEPVPVIMSAHPYGKDKVPANTRSGRGVNFQYRLFPQPQPIRFSDRTSWEAPDPANWVAHGYAVVNADLRGGGTSDGVDDLLSEQEARDYADLVEWVAAQPWCTGKVGLDGVSYLAISQYRVAALRPPHLAAICPWEGFTDVYRDFAYPGGVREDGFSVVWGKVTAHAARVVANPRKEFRSRPELDDWYRAHTPELERIEVPMLVCASFSDQLLHTRGSFEAFRRAGSARKWLYTHRGGKWSHYYSASATEERRRFFDHLLRGEDNGWDRRPAARIAVHEEGPEPAEVLMADTWPPSEGVHRYLLHLHDVGTLREEAPARTASAAFDLRRGRLHWDWQPAEDVDVLGPMAVTVHVSVAGTADPLLVARVRKLRAGREVTFEGS